MAIQQLNSSGMPILTGQCGAAVDQKYIYITGGSTGNSLATASNATYRYNINLDRWENLNLPFPFKINAGTYVNWIVNQISNYRSNFSPPPVMKYWVDLEGNKKLMVFGGLNETPIVNNSEEASINRMIHLLDLDANGDPVGGWYDSGWTTFRTGDTNRSTIHGEIFTYVNPETSASEQWLIYNTSSAGAGAGAVFMKFDKLILTGASSGSKSLLMSTASKYGLVSSGQQYCPDNWNFFIANNIIYWTSEGISNTTYGLLSANYLTSSGAHYITSGNTTTLTTYTYNIYSDEANRYLTSATSEYTHKFLLFNQTPYLLDANNKLRTMNLNTIHTTGLRTTLVDLAPYQTYSITMHTLLIHDDVSVYLITGSHCAVVQNQATTAYLLNKSYKNTTVLTSPTLFSVSISANYPNITWKDTNSDATHFMIERKFTNGLSWEELITIPATLGLNGVYTYLDTTLNTSNNTQACQYRIRTKKVV